MLQCLCSAPNCLYFMTHFKMLILLCAMTGIFSCYFSLRHLMLYQCNTFSNLLISIHLYVSLDRQSLKVVLIQNQTDKRPEDEKDAQVKDMNTLSCDATDRTVEDCDNYFGDVILYKLSEIHGQNKFCGQCGGINPKPLLIQKRCEEILLDIFFPTQTTGGCRLEVPQMHSAPSCADTGQ